MLEQSIVSRSPSGQWYPQQQQQQLPHVPLQPYGNMAGHPQVSPQWGMMSSPATPVVPPGGANANLGNSGTFNGSNANLWNAALGTGQGGAGAQPGMTGRALLNGPTLTPQQQLMMQQGTYQDECCASCCGPQQQCCGSASGCCGPTGCCCGPTGCCCPMPGEPPDPYCCTPPMPGQEPPCYISIYNCFDWTFFLACLLFFSTVVGFAVVVATKSKDDIFKKFGVRNTTELDAAMRPYIIWMNVNASNTTDDSSSASDIFSRDSASSAVVNRVASILQNAAAAATAGSLAKVSAAASAVTTTPGTVVAFHNNTPHNCTQRKLLGSFGVICMEDNLYANVFAVQLSTWTNARNTLWFLAMVYSGFTLIYAVLVHVQRHPANGYMGAAGGPNVPPTITQQEQEEFAKMTPPQQQAFMQEYQQRVAAVLQQQQQQQQPYGGYPQQPGEGCCGSNSGIALYDTPFYEFVRIAWFVSGLTAFVWTCNLFLSFWAFSNFYINHTSGPLRAFWRDYTHKMNSSLVVVTVFLAWPLCNIFLELVFWVIGVLPWFVIRSTCKRGIEMYRPALPLSQLPMYIRADMYFMDFQDVKRLGFSRQAWVMLTGSDRPFFDSCEDPTVDKDPVMTQLMQLRMQWLQTMMSMMPPWMQQAGIGGSMNNQQQQMMMTMGGGAVNNTNNSGIVGPAGAGASSAPSQVGTPATIATNGAVLPTHSPATTPAEYPVEENEAKTHRRRRHGTHDRHRHLDPSAAGTGAAPSGNSNLPRTERSALGQSNVNGGAGSSRQRRRHRSKSRSRSKAAFENGLATPVPPGTDAVVAAGGNSPGATTRHRRRHSRSREKGASDGYSPSPEVPVPVPVPPAASGAAMASREGGHRRRHSHSRSRSRSKAANAGEASVPAVAGGAPDTQHRHRPRSHSRSKEQASSKAAAAAKDLDALMQL